MVMPNLLRTMYRPPDLRVQDIVRDLVEGGEAQLLRAEAERRYELNMHQVNRGAIDIVMMELLQLHTQLNSITTQCTCARLPPKDRVLYSACGYRAFISIAVIIGFALASIGADTLSVLADDNGQFCIYKSVRARAYVTPA